MYYFSGTTQTLERLQLAIKGQQKMFVSHASVQQLLATLWYDGLPGFKRMSMFKQLATVVKHSCMFPLYAMTYIIAPTSPMGQMAR